MSILTLPIRAVLFAPTFARWVSRKTGIDWALVAFWLCYFAIFAFGVWSIFK